LIRSFRFLKLTELATRPQTFLRHRWLSWSRQVKQRKRSSGDHKRRDRQLMFALESCSGWKFLAAPAPHPQNLNPPRNRGNLRNLTRKHLTRRL